MRDSVTDPYEGVEASAAGVERAALCGLAAQRSITRLWVALAVWILLALGVLVLVVDRIGR
ncbi:hypothetical protein [Micromonospora sp. NPDC049801]|uniref:hypothetical protein n=1 Tax=unclassified Micromonospora TaxID=2617518 RepID=UPI0033F40007